MTSEWLIVLNADGTVLAVDGGAPVDWIDTRLEDRTDIPAEVRDVAVATRRQFDETANGARAVSRAIASASQTIRLLMLPALAVHRVATDVRSLLKSTIDVMERQARALDVALTQDVGSDVPPTLMLDPEKMAWAITALIGNALRFVRRGSRLMPGGTIQVRTRYEPALSRVTLEVQDDGSGISKQMLSELLQRPAGRLHASGLALSLVRDIMVAHGGDAEVDSSTEPGRSGTTIRLVVPFR